MACPHRGKPPTRATSYIIKLSGRDLCCASEDLDPADEPNLGISMVPHDSTWVFFPFVSLKSGKLLFIQLYFFKKLCDLKTIIMHMHKGANLALHGQLYFWHF